MREGGGGGGWGRRGEVEVAEVEGGEVEVAAVGLFGVNEGRGVEGGGRGWRRWGGGGRGGGGGRKGWSRRWSTGLR